jgi:hyperosmotically inducible protein
MKMNNFKTLSFAGLAVVILVLLALGSLPINQAYAKETTSNSNNVVTDSTITAAIKTKLAANSEISALDVHVSTNNGRVLLTGIVPSKRLKSQVIEIANSVSGVKNVVSDLVIDPEHSKESSSVSHIIPDSAITAALKAKFLADERINGLDIHVETINGEVTLVGMVPNESIKERAEAIANNTNGVKNIVSKLKVEGK